MHLLIQLVIIATIALTLVIQTQCGAFDSATAKGADSALLYFRAKAVCPTSPPGSCPTGDCVCSNVETYVKCTESSVMPPTYNCIWQAGLDPMLDYRNLNGKIAAYKLRWFNGSWSGWYVPGMNDMDKKNSISPLSCFGQTFPAFTQRRMWAYFTDHYHKYILCKETF